MKISGQLEGLSREERQEKLQKMLDATDWEAHGRRVLWGLNVPRCLCGPCYRTWLEWGKELYKDNPERYEEIVERENRSREQRESSRKLAKEKYAQAFS